MKIKLVSKYKIASDIYTLKFEKPSDFSYQAGQYVQLLPEFKQSMDERGAKRWFTLSSSPTEDYLSITTRHVSEHPSTFKDALFALKPGSLISIDEPEGDFILPNDERHIVWIAGGIGITPFRSQLKYLIDTKQQKSIWLIYSVRSQADICFGQEFEQAKTILKDFNLTITLTDQVSNDKSFQSGLVTDQMMSTSGEIANSHYFVSGPGPMVDDILARLKQLGASSELLHDDWFPGYKDKF